MKLKEARFYSSNNYFRLLYSFLLLFGLIFFISCNNADDNAKPSSLDSVKISDTNRAGEIPGSKDNNTDSGSKQLTLQLPTYQITVSALRDLHQGNGKQKVILKIYFPNFPETQSAKLIVYGATSLTHDGTNERDSLIIDPSTTLSSISTNAFSISNNHVNLRRILRRITTQDYVLFTPVVIGKNLVYKMTAYEDTALTSIELGFSNPSPPAPPGGIP